MNNVNTYEMNTEISPVMETLFVYLKDALQPAYDIALEKFPNTYPALCLSSQKELVKDHYDILGGHHVSIKFAIKLRMDAALETAAKAYSVFDHITKILNGPLPNLGDGMQCKNIMMVSNPVLENTNESHIDFMAEYVLAYICESTNNK